MTTTTIDRAGTWRQEADVLAELRDAYLEAAAIVADLDLDDAPLWLHIDGMVAELAAAAYRMTADVTGEPSRTTATNVPPIVRVRELAMAQRRLFAVVDGPSAPARDLVEHAILRVRRLGRLLRA